MDAQDVIKYKYEALKEASVSQDLNTINDLVVDILSLLHKEWSSVAGTQKDTFEEAYCQVDNTFAAHKKTKQDTSNSCYLNEIGLQIGRDLDPVFSVSARRSSPRNKVAFS